MENPYLKHFDTVHLAVPVPGTFPSGAVHAGVVNEYTTACGADYRLVDDEQWAWQAPCANATDAEACVTCEECGAMSGLTLLTLPKPYGKIKA